MMKESNEDLTMSEYQDKIIKKITKEIRVSKEKLFGWGRYAYTDCVIAYPQNVDELKELLKICLHNGYSITPKGGGCSFGDLITNKKGIVVDLACFNEVIDFNKEKGILTTQGGTSAGRVLNHVLPYNWMMRGLPGTSFGTMAGFIANNVHGKDSFKNGHFGRGVIFMKMLLASGEIINLSREENPDIFNAVIGGMGLLGIIIEATFQLIKIPGSMVEVERKYFRSIPELFNLFLTVTDDIDMDAAWIDGFDKNGRGIFQTAKWLNKNPDVVPESMEKIQKKLMGKIPINLAYPLIKPFVCRTSMSALNKLAYWGSKTSKNKNILHLYQYYYPHMTSIPDSPKAMEGGLVGFQIIVPDDKACEFIMKLLDVCRKYKLESWFLGVKRHKLDPYLLSFAEDGYSTTIEIPGRFTKLSRFSAFLDKMISLAVDYNGKINLAKDALLKPHHIRVMYPKLPEFLEIKQKLDPNKLFGSDHSRRLLLNS